MERIERRGKEGPTEGVCLEIAGLHRKQKPAAADIGEPARSMSDGEKLERGEREPVAILIGCLEMTNRMNFSPKVFLMGDPHQSINVPL